MIEEVKTAYQGWGRLLIATIVLPDGSRITREMEDHGAATCVLPYDPERRVALLVRQLRAPALHVAGEPDVLEAPAGLLVGEADQSARREVMEETGANLGALEPVVNGWSMPGISTERMQLYLAAYSAADRTGRGGGLPGEGEAITVVEMPLAELAELADSGGLSDLKTLLLLQTLRLRRPELFGR